tara:strand:+ start:3678 stop:4934 length:1257 start_codon:yes stop_codon:yes gene_type:complete
MFNYLDKIFNNSKQVSNLEGKVKAFSLENVFTKEHYEKLSNDVVKYEEFTKQDEPKEGIHPSIITLEEIEKIDIFYEELWKYFNSNEVKLKVLEKFGYTADTLKLVNQNISFHTEYPHQIDKSHTDQKFTLQTVTLQIYLPKDDSIKNYGTRFSDNKDNVIFHNEFLPNAGYIMGSNINSWHYPTMGVERKSLVVRYFIQLDYEKSQTVFNYNKNNSTCYIVWNKDMDVLPKITDWMSTMTIINLSKHKFENIVALTKPFKDKLKYLKKLKEQGFNKAVVFFGGFMFETDEIKKYADTLDMKEVIAGMPIGDQFARQCFILNLNRLDEITETDPKGRFFERFINNDSIDITDLVSDNRKYYHPEPEDEELVNDFIRLDSGVKEVQDNHLKLYNKLKYILPYRQISSDLSFLTHSTYTL